MLCIELQIITIGASAKPSEKKEGRPFDKLNEMKDPRGRTIRRRRANQADWYCTVIHGKFEYHEGILKERTQGCGYHHPLEKTRSALEKSDGFNQLNALQSDGRKELLKSSRGKITFASSISQVEATKVLEKVPRRSTSMAKVNYCTKQLQRRGEGVSERTAKPRTLC